MCLTVQVDDENLACLDVCYLVGKIQMFLHDVLGNDYSEYHVALVYIF
jgi:hypothetical protein